MAFDYKKEYKEFYLPKNKPGIAFTIKVSKKGDRQIDGYFDYVVPPLEGFWWQDGVIGVDYSNKDSFVRMTMNLRQ